MDVDAGGAEIFDAGQECRGSNAVAQRDFFGRRHLSRRITVLAKPKIFLAERVERCLSDTSGDHDEMLGFDRWKAVAERSPDFQLDVFARARELARHFTESEVDEVD